MSENLVVNDVTYPGVDALMMVNEKGEQVPFYPDAVRYNQQTLTEEQKAQARENVGALSSGDVSSVLQQAKDSGDFKGDTGRRGTGLLPVTTAPSAYTTAVNGLIPAYRIALSTVKSQASTTEVFAGDTVRYSYYHYPVIYVDSSYVYCGARVSIRGATGAAGHTPVKGTDYWTPADQEAIVQQVITALGTPVFGRVDADNNIILTGTLGEGTYTFKYEDAEGNVTMIGTITNEPEPTYTNLLPTALGYDGTPLNGVGYIDGYRLTSEQKVANNNSYLSALSGYFATGFIPYTNAQAKACVPFYIKGVNLDTLDDNMRIYLFKNYNSSEYSEAVKLLSTTGTNGVTITKLADSYYKITPKMNFYSNGEWATQDTKYVRFSFKGSGSGVIITINEPIE